MNSITAKMQVQTVLSNGVSETTKLYCKYSDTPEDNSFAKATPSGNMELVIDNPAAQGFLKPMKTYFITITEAPEQ